MSTELPQIVPLSLVPFLLGRDQATVSRWAARDHWDLITPPGLVRRKLVALAELERRYGVTFTEDQIQHAMTLHTLKRKSEAIAVRSRRALSPAAADLFPSMEDTSQPGWRTPHSQQGPPHEVHRTRAR